jgi:hypothetical protein
MEKNLKGVMGIIRTTAKSVIVSIGQAILRPFLTEADLSQKFSYAVKVSQKALSLNYQDMQKRSCLPTLCDTGYRIFSEADEDGIFVFIFAVIGTTNKIFVDIGSSDGIKSNCANLAINFGWHGLFIDGKGERISRGKAFYKKHPDTHMFPPRFVHARVTLDNVNQCIRSAGFSGEIDLMSIDIDGNDYWIWDAIDCINPRVVCIETRVEFGCNDVVAPYNDNPTGQALHPDYFGASPVAMVRLSKKKGYRLIGANMYGYNTIYVRDDLGQDSLPEVSVESVLRHPGNREWQQLFQNIKDLPNTIG